MDQKVQVYIEIEKDTNVKYEYNTKEKKLVIDRILPEPFYYPYCYGFIKNTRAQDGDELDALIITDKHLPNDTVYQVNILGVLLMEDEKGIDEKIICVLEEDYNTLNNLYDLPEESLEKVKRFFEDYKKKTPRKWSRVFGYMEKQGAIELYKKYR
jgi:inorganic pyrophosphatase